MRTLLACLCLAASAALAGCSALGAPEPSTPRAIESDISAAHNTGPTAEQIGDASVVPDVIGTHDNVVVPTVTLRMNNAY